MNNDIEESYCSFEVSKLLKEKGYRNETLRYYIDINGKHSNIPTISSAHLLGANWNSYPSEENSSRVSCPTHALAIEWIRVNFGIWIEIFMDDNNTFGYLISKIIEKGRVDYPIQREFNSPQEATEAALLYVLNNLI